MTGHFATQWFVPPNEFLDMKQVKDHGLVSCGPAYSFRGQKDGNFPDCTVKHWIL